MPANAAVTARQVLVSDLRRYLVGPLDDEERIPEKPIDRYHAGLLSPPQTPIDAEEDDQEQGDQEVDSGVGESILALVNVRQQSAMGMTFQVEDTVRKLCLRVSWAGYVPEPDKENPLKVWWVRKPIERNFDLVLSKKAGRKPALLGEIDGIRLYVVSGFAEGVFTLTTSLVNNRPLLMDWDRDDRIYQVRLDVSAADQSAVFVARPPSGYLRDDELWNFELLYRTRKAFAAGHGCAVQWESTDGRRASRIWTEWVPEAEVFKATPEVLANDRLLALDNLTDFARRTGTCADLRRLPQAYAAWIKQSADGLATILEEFPEIRRKEIRKAAERNLKACEEAYQRIVEGITLLENDDLAWRAFCLANQAMVQSMRKSRPSEGEPRWFAFQMAFLLLSLPSTVDPTHADRTTFDLIWFPTGGGKTEAYLGLTAFCLFYRRLAATRPEDQEGTAVLTRYTLRLLTIQQFERAARVICACELVRRGLEVELGAAEFSIGLLVGNTATPGSIEDARKLLAGDSVGDGNLTTLPLVECPWCGTALTTREQRVVGTQLLTRCPNPRCEFRKRLPVAVVDEEIFCLPPSMVVATVDKFARMAWVPEIKAIFGRGIPSRPPPMMIIQDELHLISDALGTVVALYETAIDHLCQANGRPPKVIGSTATIRRAEDQCWGLFQRKAVPFPPSGLLASDSFFYSEDTSQPGRVYIGVHAQGRSPKFSLARLVGTLCQLASRIPDLETRDSFHTLVLYFNSLRELGGALVMAEDEVPRYVQSMPRKKGEPPRELIHIQELTSHIPSGSIPEVLKKIEEPLPGLPGSTMQREPLDLVLATNMISVGIDVDRLGLMVVNGQPKTTAEYIQATSRVGRPRGSAGLVVTLYNWTRPRDRSHYERFLAYHQTFYRFVEPTSVTPFSERARDRALHAVLVSLARLLLVEFQDKDSAKNITDLGVQRRVRELASIIVARARENDRSEVEDTETHLDELVNEWVEEAESPNDLFWEKNRFMQGKRALLRAAEVENTARGLWATPNSMRDVEPPSPVLLYTNKRITERGGTDGAETED